MVIKVPGNVGGNGTNVEFACHAHIYVDFLLLRQITKIYIRLSRD